MRDDDVSGRERGDEDLKIHERRIFWIAMVMPPAIWFANLGVTYAFASEACVGGRAWPIYATLGVSLVAATVATVFAYREWKQLGEPHRALHHGERGLAEFLAAGGHYLTAFFLAVTAGAILPPLLLGGCLL